MFVYPKAGHRPALGIFFSLPQEEEKMKQMLNTLNILSVNVQIIYIYIYIYIYNTYIYYRTLYTVVSL